MDSNNFNPQPMPNGQPMGQPPMNGQPMPNQPMGPAPYPNGQSMGQPYPYPQPPVKPPKQPMDPAKKKKIILIVSICSVLVVLGIVAAIVIPILLRVDYGPAYAAAKEVKPKVYDIYRSYDCEYVTDYVDSTYTSIKNYTEYIEGCKKVYSTDIDELINKLGDTAGVKRNNEIDLQFQKFKDAYNSVIAGKSEDLSAKLDIWLARHNFVYTADDLNYNSSDAEFTTAANYLINSGNDALKTYGEGWLERNLEIAAAYRAYRAAPLSSWSEAYNTYTNKRNEFSDWAAVNKPDIKTIAPLNFNDTSKMYSEFNTLYDLITETYEENYNYGSGDCSEFLGVPYCD